MKRFLNSSIVLSILILASCLPAPTATNAPSDTLAPAFTETSTSTIVPTVAPTSTVTAEEVEGYIDKLELIYESPMKEVRFGGADGPVINVGLAVEHSGLSHGIGRVEMPDPLLAETTMRALHSIFAPEEEDTPENLQAFADKLAAIQRGDPGVSCADVMHSLKVYNANGNGGSEVLNLVPPCGLSPVPEGVTELSGGVKMVYGSWYTASDEGGKNVPDIDAKWFNTVTDAGDGYGVLLDQEQGILYIFIGAGSTMREEKTNLYVGMYTQMMVDWLEKYSQGERFYPKSTEEWAKTSFKMINSGLNVKTE